MLPENPVNICIIYTQVASVQENESFMFCFYKELNEITNNLSNFKVNFFSRYQIKQIRMSSKNNILF